MSLPVIASPRPDRRGTALDLWLTHVIDLHTCNFIRFIFLSYYSYYYCSYHHVQAVNNLHICRYTHRYSILFSSSFHATLALLRFSSWEEAPPSCSPSSRSFRFIPASKASAASGLSAGGPMGRWWCSGGGGGSICICCCWI